MNAQAEQMRGFVQDLIAIVGGSTKGETRLAHTRANTPKTRTDKALAVPVRKEVVVDNSREINPEQVIPMDDDFADI
jgi:methyl-accepting chemotaxis protein